MCIVVEVSKMFLHEMKPQTLVVNLELKRENVIGLEFYIKLDNRGSKTLQ